MAKWRSTSRDRSPSPAIHLEQPPWFNSSRVRSTHPRHQQLPLHMSQSSRLHHDLLFLTQITPNTPLILLDVWCFPLRTSTSRWLWNKPLPCYAPGGPGGCGVLAVESQAFYKWRIHLKATKRLLSPNPASETHTVEDDGRPGPHFYYPTASAHLSQSDFGILFPWVTRRMYAIEEPERIMKLNVRAILQLLRERHVPVSPTSASDMEIGSETDMVTKDDSKIFCMNGEIKGWNYLTRT